jgi:hypothetical protein
MVASAIIRSAAIYRDEKNDSTSNTNNMNTQENSVTRIETYHRKFVGARKITSSERRKKRRRKISFIITGYSKYPQAARMIPAFFYRNATASHAAAKGPLFASNSPAPKKNEVYVC